MRSSSFRAALTVSVTLCIVDGPGIQAQSSSERGTATPLAQFEAASIKPTKGCTPGPGVTPGRVSLCGALTFYIQASYDLYSKGSGFYASAMTNFWTTDIKGAPRWLASESYQIDARANGNPPYMVMMGPMLQALFEDRLKLKIHRETREVPVYELTLAKGGPKLRRPEDDTCAIFDRTVPPPQPGAPGAPQRRPCGGIRVGRGTLDFADMSMTELAQHLGRNILDRPVINKTQLVGRFTFRLEFAPDETTPLLFSRSESQTGPSIFTAMQEQLGLKLERAKGPAELLVIDSVEPPSEN